MKKLFCFTVFFAVIQCYSQSYETKFIEQPAVAIHCESFVILSDFSKIRSAYATPPFHIKSGSLIINVSGIIDKTAPSQIMISLSAKETLYDEMIIIASKDSQQVQYKIEGSGSGLYGGKLNDNDNYIINTSFKIIAPGLPAYTLVLPLNVQISKSGNNNLINCFINGAAFIYKADKKKNKTRNKNVI